MKTTMPSDVPFARWFVDHWMRVGIVMAVILLLITPVLILEMPWTIVLVYLQLPIYMLHQYEEHANGAFQRYATQTMGHGKMVLSATDIFWINVGLVWVFDLVWLLMAVFVHPFWGLIAVGTAVVNGTLHLIFGIKDRAYNPGLWTGIFIFLPVGMYAMLMIGHSIQASTTTYILALVGAVLTHAPIVAFVRKQLCRTQLS